MIGWIKSSALALTAWHLSSVVTVLQLAVVKVTWPGFYEGVMNYALPPAQLLRDVLKAVWESALEMGETLLA